MTDRYLCIFRWRAFPAALALVAQFLASAPTLAAASFNVYFVAVGSSHYGQSTGSGTHGLQHIYGANKSAKAIAARLLAGGAKYGVLLTSVEGHLVSAGDVSSAISLVDARMRVDRAKNPLLVFYFAGHGISEGVGWNLFMVPGTFLYTGDLADHDIESIAASTIPAAKLVEQLDHTGVRYVAVLDTCYEGKAPSIDSPVLSGAAIASLRNVSSVLRFMNEFHQSSPVLFSTAPGRVVATVDDPVDATSDPVAPLARRVMILLDNIATKKEPLKLHEFVRQMTSKDLDSKTAPAISNASSAPDWNETLLLYTSNSGALVERMGSAPIGEKCCDSATKTGERPASANSETKFNGAVELTGAEGEFITGGATMKFSGEFTASQDDLSSLTLSFAENGRDWELSFGAPPGSTLRAGSFADAVRYSFADKGQPSIAISGAGHACNEVRGSFAVQNVKLDSSGRVTEFAARFEQYCDDNKALLRGRVSVATK
jgi:hypothetical protein